MSFKRPSAWVSNASAIQMPDELTDRVVVPAGVIVIAPRSMSLSGKKRVPAGNCARPNKRTPPPVPAQHVTYDV
ncbi:hypothetical protein [Amycolatopsis sp. YIM 10]|uniref:hypothetical protein n=1 Tax=Amycolatopsis sp. YIM 10 TaxID=2653857 RepID=UPI00129026AF|nr:hypothetical protein [Amycolatopsis sp. YIM 10]